MSGLPSQHSTLTVAQESLRMGEKTGDRTFKILGIVMMGATALGTLFHAARMLFKDMRDDRRQARGNSHPAQPPDIPDTSSYASHDDDRPRGKWTHRPELADRDPRDSHAQAAHRPQHNHASQR